MGFGRQDIQFYALTEGQRLRAPATSADHSASAATDHASTNTASDSYADGRAGDGEH
jgi:hypothetical protein